MALDNQALELLARRVEKLELQNRRWRYAGLFLIIAFTSVFVIAQVKTAKVTPPKATKPLEAGKFILQDGLGAKRAELSMFANRPALVFYDETANPALSIGMEAEGAGLTLYDTKSEKAAVLSFGSGGPVLSLFHNGNKRLNLSVTAQGPAVGLLGRKNEAKAAFGLTAEDNPFLHLFGPGEQGGAQLLAAADRTVLRFFDASEKARAVLGIVDKESAPGLVLNDAAGNPRSILMLTQEGPGLEFFDKNRVRIWSAR